MSELKKKEIVPWHDFVAGRYLAYLASIHSALPDQLALACPLYRTPLKLFVFLYPYYLALEEW